MRTTRSIRSLAIRSSERPSAPPGSLEVVDRVRSRGVHQVGARAVAPAHYRQLAAVQRDLNAIFEFGPLAVRMHRTSGLHVAGLPSGPPAQEQVGHAEQALGLESSAEDDVRIG